MLAQENQHHKENIAKVENVEKEIKACEVVVEDNKYLFRNKEFTGGVGAPLTGDAELNLPTYTDKEDVQNGKDDHSYSLLQMLRVKHARCVKKLELKQKEFERLQKELHYTELNELFVDITELKAEIKRIEETSEAIVKELYASLEITKNNSESVKATKNDVLMANGKSRVIFCEETRNQDKSRSRSNSASSFKNNQDKLDSGSKRRREDFKVKPIRFLVSGRPDDREKSGHKNKSNGDNGTSNYEKKRIFLINHMIIQQLFQSNQNIYHNAESVNKDNRRLTKLNGVIDEKINVKKKALGKANGEKNKKASALGVLQNEEAQQAFESREGALKGGLE